jgi:hypothetical protein
MRVALDKTFELYDNSELATTGQGPISDADKQTLKYNLRKQDLFEQALFFIHTQFGTTAHEKMSPALLLQLTSCLLSIVLSHHFQKKDIKSMVKGTEVDFMLVRDTMYKYSKKAEEKFFRNPCLAYFFV